VITTATRLTLTQFHYADLRRFVYWLQISPQSHATPFCESHLSKYFSYMRNSTAQQATDTMKLWRSTQRPPYSKLAPVAEDPTAPTSKAFAGRFFRSVGCLLLDEGTESAYCWRVMCFLRLTSGADTVWHGRARAPHFQKLLGTCLPLSDVAGLRAGVVPPTSELLPAPLRLT
jgi:hypothetical protein